MIPQDHDTHLQWCLFLTEERKCWFWFAVFADVLLEIDISFIRGDREALLCHSFLSISVLLVLLFPLLTNCDKASSSVSGKSGPKAGISPLNSLMKTDSRKRGHKIFSSVSLLTWISSVTSQWTVRTLFWLQFLTHVNTFLILYKFVEYFSCSLFAFSLHPPDSVPLPSIFRTYLFVYAFSVSCTSFRFPYSAAYQHS